MDGQSSILEERKQTNRLAIQLVIHKASWVEIHITNRFILKVL